MPKKKERKKYIPNAVRFCGLILNGFWYFYTLSFAMHTNCSSVLATQTESFTVPTGDVNI